MTSKQRIRAILAGEPVDRAPVAAWRHFPVDDQDPAALAASTVAFAREYDWDLVKVTPDQTYVAELWGVPSAYSGDPMGVRDLLTQPIRRLEDWRELARTRPTGHEPQITNYVESIRLVREALGEEAVVLNTVFSPISIARYISSEELFQASVREAPAALGEFLKVAADLAEVIVQRTVQEGGADGSYISLFSAGSGSFSLDEYREIAGETDARTFAASPGWLNVAHFHAPYPLLELAADYAVDAVSWDCSGQRLSVSEVARRCPGKLPIGGIDQQAELLSGTATEVTGAASRVLSSGVPAVLAPGCTIPQTTPHGNLRALRAAVETQPSDRAATPVAA